MRAPNPVLIKPRASKKAITISQIVRELKLDNVWSIVKVRVNTQVAMLKTATAPIGSGLTTMQTIVVINIANRCQACIESPVGTGANQIVKAIAKIIKLGLILAPSQVNLLV